MRKPIIAANWKMHKTVGETESFIEHLILDFGNETDVEIVLIPPFTAIAKAAEALEKNENIKLGAQNMHPEPSGAFTGEISGEMLRELYVRYVVIGHSERRTLFGEDDEFIHQKMAAALKSQLRPILCIGETLKQRDAGNVQQVLEKQLHKALENLDAKQLDEIVIAYEPVWAIGTGRTATAEQAQEAHAFIRKELEKMAGAETAKRIRIQYGGSVKPGNAEELMNQPDIDGALIGGASLDVHSFAEIIKAAKKAQKVL